MRDQQVNTFTKGILNDPGDLSPVEGSYLDSKNIRIIANENPGESGINVNVKGNLFSLSLELPPRTPGDDPIPAVPIGHASIRNDLYIFATYNFDKNPGNIVGPGGLDAQTAAGGGIFKITFDLVTDEVTSINLIYENQFLNLSVQHPIEAVGRFETQDVQRLYFTDNFNPVRTINVADPNVMSIQPDDLQLSPSTTFSKPEILEVVNSGNLPAGMYQYAYRLVTKSGSQSRFSPFTGFLHVVAASELGDDYWTYTEDPEDISQYEGVEPGTICNKAVRLQVENVDTDYSVIEFAAIYKSSIEGVSNSYIFSRKTIGSPTITATHSTNIDIVSLVSLAEITSFTYNIKRAKTITSKDNRLFLGNVITPLEELEFNARAYRYKRDDGSVYPTSSGSSSTYVDDIEFDPTNYSPEDYTAEEIQALLDADNPYNENLRAVTDSNNRYVYQNNGYILGGSGPNVSYKFIKKEFDGDEFVSGDPATTPPFIKTEPSSTTDCGVGVDWLDYKNPLAVEKYKGYQRDEIYRFGIVLYDKKGNPGFVNWVGDIRFPRFGDFDPEASGDTHSYTLSQTRSKAQAEQGVPYAQTGSQSGVSYSQIGGLEGEPDIFSQLSTGYGRDNTIDTHSLYVLGIEFTVDLPQSIKNKVSGYSIVRVERSELDRSVFGQGMGSWLYLFASQTSGSLADTFRLAHSAYMATWAHDNGSTDQRTDAGMLWSTHMSMDSPDFVFTGNYPTAGACDWVEVVGNLTNGASRNAWENHFLDGTGDDDDYYRKMYSHQVIQYNVNSNQSFIYGPGNTMQSGNASQNFFKPADAKFWASGASITSDANLPRGINNVGVEVNGNTDVDVYGIGCDTLFIEFNGNGRTASNGGNYVGSLGSTWLGDVILPSISSNPVAVNFPYWSYWTNPALSLEAAEPGWTAEAYPNQIYFNDGDVGDDNLATSYFPGATSFDVCTTGNGNHAAAYQRHRVQEKPLLSWRRDVMETQYGGRGYDNRSRNKYINANSFVPIGDADEPVEVYGGDIFVSFYDFQKMRKRRGGQAPDSNYSNNTSGPTKRHSFSYAIPVESTINLGLRQGYHFAAKNVNTGFTGNANDNHQLDEYIYQNVYSAENDLLEFYPRTLDYVETDQYDSRVLYSDVKVNGDLKDSWKEFRLDNYRDVEGEYGPINKIVNFSDNMFFLQDRGVGMLSINPVAVTTTTDQASLILGTGEVIQDHKYMSTEIGSKHQRSVLATTKGLYWVDILNNSAYKISNEGTLELSRVKGIKSYFESRLENKQFASTYYNSYTGQGTNLGDNAFLYHGITTGYDASNNEVLFSFLERKFVDDGDKGWWELFRNETLVYSETTGSFTSKYSFATPMFINTQDKLLSVRPLNYEFDEVIEEVFRVHDNEIWIHNEIESLTAPRASWYGDVYDSSITFLVNKGPSQTKVFDNIEMYTKLTNVLGQSGDINGTWNKLLCTNSYQLVATDLYGPLQLPDITVDEVEDPEEVTQNIKRRERTWKAALPRVVKGGTPVRLRDKYLKINLRYDNKAGGKLQTYYVKTKFRVSKR